MKKTKTVLSGTKAIFISLAISLAVLLLLVLICSLVISKKENHRNLELLNIMMTFTKFYYLTYA